MVRPSGEANPHQDARPIGRIHQLVPLPGPLLHAFRPKRRPRSQGERQRLSRYRPDSSSWSAVDRRTNRIGAWKRALRAARRKTVSTAGPARVMQTKFVTARPVSGPGHARRALRRQRGHPPPGTARVMTTPARGVMRMPWCGVVGGRGSCARRRPSGSRGGLTPPAAPSGRGVVTGFWRPAARRPVRTRPRRRRARPRRSRPRPSPPPGRRSWRRTPRHAWRPRPLGPDQPRTDRRRRHRTQGLRRHLTPTSATTTLGALLDAAQTSAAPTGCVTETTPGTGDGTITSVNGKTNNGSSTWKSSPDGTPAAAASRGTVINAGDTIALRYGG